MESNSSDSDENVAIATLKKRAKKKHNVKDGCVGEHPSNNKTIKADQKDEASLHNKEKPPYTAAIEAIEDLLYEDEYDLKTEDDDLDKIILDDVDFFESKNFLEELPIDISQSESDPSQTSVPPRPPVYNFTTAVVKQENFDSLPSDEHSSPKDPETCRSRSPVKELGRRGGPGRSRRRGNRRGRDQRGRAREEACETSSGPNTRQFGDRVAQVCIIKAVKSLSTVVQKLERSRAEREVEEKCRRLRRRQQQGEHEDFYVPDEGQDSVLLRDEDRQFHWSSMDSFRGKREAFVPESTGSVAYYATIYEAFRSYWDDSILAEIVEETNRHAKSIITAEFLGQWYDTNAHEILILFAFWIMLGVLKMPTTQSCFSRNPLLRTDVFRSMFTLRRYQSLARALHFANDEARPRDAPRLYCFGRVLEHLNSKFQQNFVPAQNVVIDETLTMGKGMLYFKQLNRLKVVRFGIKTFELCDSVTGYLWRIVVYTGESSNDEPVSDSPVLKSTEVVIKLMRPLLNKGHTLFLDSWFNSPVLARFLKSKGTDCVGTVRSTRKEVPSFLTHAYLRQGEFVGRHAGDLSVMAWEDKNRVLMISTYHGMEQGDASTGSRQSDQSKPQLLLDYHKNTGAVPRKYQVLEPYLMERKKCKKWYMKLFKYLLNCSIVNSHILVESSTSGKMDSLESRLQLVDLIITNHLSQVPQTPTRSTLCTLSSFFVDNSQQHWPGWLDNKLINSRRLRKRCVNCHKQGLINSRTVLQCERCKVPLCAVPCFKEFHQ